MPWFKPALASCGERLSMFCCGCTSTPCHVNKSPQLLCGCTNNSHRWAPFTTALTKIIHVFTEDTCVDIIWLCSSTNKNGPEQSRCAAAMSYSADTFRQHTSLPSGPAFFSEMAYRMLNNLWRVLSGVLQAEAIQSKTQHEHTLLNKTHYQICSFNFSGWKQEWNLTVILKVARSTPGFMFSLLQKGNF